MCCQHLNADLRAHQDRSAGCCHDAVGCGGRNAHAKHDAADHGKQQCDDHDTAGCGYDGTQELGCKTGGGDTACHDTSHGTRRRFSDGTFAACFQSINDLAQANAVVGVEQANYDGYQDCDGCGALHGTGTVRYQNHQDYQRSQQVKLLY